MFSWICPKCGREVPPAYNDCPTCAPQTAAPTKLPQAPEPPQYQQPVYAPPPPQYAPPPPPPPPPQYQQPVYAPPPAQPPQFAPPAPPAYQQPVYAPPPQEPPPQQYAQPPYAPPQEQYPPQYAQPQYPQQPPAPAPAAQTYTYLPEQSSGMPTWLLTILFTAGFAALIAGVYYGYQRFGSGGGESKKSAIVAPPSGSKAHPMLRYVEVVGLRLTQDAKKKTEARFVIVNHSAGDLPEIAGTIYLRGKTREGKLLPEPVAAFPVKASGIGPYESKDLKALVETDLKVYELPDWQFLDVDFQITSPAP